MSLRTPALITYLYFAVAAAAGQTARRRHIFAAALAARSFAWCGDGEQ